MRKRLVRAVLMLLLLCGIGAFVLWRLSLAAPDWYHPPDPASRVIAALADDVEYHVVQNVQQNRPTEPRWAIRLSQHEVNSWLATRLRKWVEHDADVDWPASLGTPQFLFEPDRISIALPIDDGSGRSRTVVARLHPSIDNGKLTIAIDRVAIGRIELPGEPMANLLQELSAGAPEVMADSRLREVIDAISQRRNINTEFELSDGRRIRLIGVRISDKQIDLTAETLHAGN